MQELQELQDLVRSGTMKNSQNINLSEIQYWQKQCFYREVDAIKDKKHPFLSDKKQHNCSSRNDPSIQKEHLEIMRTETQ